MVDAKQQTPSGIKMRGGAAVYMRRMTYTSSRKEGVGKGATNRLRRGEVQRKM
jgi:hypothetical protein